MWGLFRNGKASRGSCEPSEGRKGRPAESWFDSGRQAFLRRCRTSILDCDLLIVDEAHRAKGEGTTPSAPH